MRGVLLLAVGALVLSACSPVQDKPADSSTSTDAVRQTTSTIDEPPPTTTTTPPPQFGATVTGPEESVYTWQTDRCDQNPVPDLPAKAFRTSDGAVNVVLSGPNNYRLVGPDFDSLEIQCSPIRVSAQDIDPSRYQFSEWMASFYTEDGDTVYAVVHNEFHGDEASFAMSQRDFSGEQGGGEWTYLGVVNGREREMEFTDGEWRISGSLCGIANWGTHPDLGCESVRRWTAPLDGDVTVTVIASDVGIGGGNGVDIGARLNGLDIWQAPIEEGDSSPITIDIPATVASGDELDFWVDSRGDASFDATGFEIEINYGERPCTTERTSCFMTALTYAVSTDGGASFTSPEPPGNFLATVPIQYAPDIGAIGLWQPSNIVKHPSDGYYYMLTQLDIHIGARNEQGECLLRTDDLSDPTSWRAWDGTGFDMKLLDPYTDTVTDPDDATCTSVVTAPAWSLTYNTYLERFVAVSEIPRLDPPGVYFRTSEDLISWSSPELIVESTIGFANQFTTPFEAYPSVIDPQSPSMSFDTVGETAYLYYTRVNTYNPLDFDLVRIPITFQR